MQKKFKYVIFHTKWGYFGIAGTENALCRCQLPEPTFARTETLLLKNLPDAHFDKNYQKNLQEQIAAYFEGVRIDLCRDLPVNLSLGDFGNFVIAVLTACRNIRFGQTTSYAALAEQSGRPAACRAVGNALAKNPMPLIIPCHRVIRSDGKIGGFSAAGGTPRKRNFYYTRVPALREQRLYGM